MDNQHKKIKGYRDLSQEEIDMMNEIKAMGENIGELVEKLDNMVMDVNTMSTSWPDSRWIDIGRTDLQKGIMALVRSVAKPESF